MSFEQYFSCHFVGDLKFSSSDFVRFFRPLFPSSEPNKWWKGNPPSSHFPERRTENRTNEFPMEKEEKRTSGRRAGESDLQLYPTRKKIRKTSSECNVFFPLRFAAQNVFCFSSASKCFCVPERTTVSIAGKLFQLFTQLFSCRCRRLLLWQKTFACFGDMKTFWTKGSREGEELLQKKESRGGRDKYFKISPFSGINLHGFFWNLRVGSRFPFSFLCLKANFVCMK